jgi:hypothetical protein
MKKSKATPIDSAGYKEHDYMIERVSRLQYSITSRYSLACSEVSKAWFIFHPNLWIFGVV